MRPERSSRQPPKKETAPCGIIPKGAVLVCVEVRVGSLGAEGTQSWVSLRRTVRTTTPKPMSARCATEMKMNMGLLGVNKLSEITPAHFFHGAPVMNEPSNTSPFPVTTEAFRRWDSGSY